MARIDDLKADFAILGQLLANAEGSAAAAIARERRILGEQIEQLETTEEVPFIDELAAKRTPAVAGRPPARRKSG